MQLNRSKKSNRAFHRLWEEMFLLIYERRPLRWRRRQKNKEFLSNSFFHNTGSFLFSAVMALAWIYQCSFHFYGGPLQRTGKIVLHLLIIGMLGWNWDAWLSFGIHPNLLPSQTPTIHPYGFVCYIISSVPKRIFWMNISVSTVAVIALNCSLSNLI